MLNNTGKLFFPKIEFDKSTEINPNSGDNKIVHLYYLDWTNKEKKCNNGESELPFRYEDKIKNLRFAISDGYLKEIRRTSWASVEELNIVRTLDSSLRFLYLKPAVAYVSVSFRLLSDSVFDSETNFYYRKPDKIVIPHLLLYKFWKNQRQVPSSMIMDYTEIPELMTIASNEELSDEQERDINEFLAFFNEDIQQK